MASPIQPARRIDDVHYDIRGPLARRAHALEQSGVEVLHLNIGNPSLFGLETPQVLREAVAAQLPHADGYGPQLGIMPAREAIAAHAQRQGFDGVTFNDVIIGNGVSELVDVSLRSLLEPGDEVLIPAPDYPLWSASVILNNARPVYYPCPAELGFEPDIGALEALITPNTRALVVINPNNPTGAVYAPASLAGIARIATDHDLWVISDEVYDTQVWSGRHVPMAGLPGMAARTLTVGSLSKSHAMTGSRLGWVAGPEAMIARMITLATHTTYGVPGYIQEAGLFALRQGAAFEADIAAPFLRRRDMVLAALTTQTAVRATPPEGAMYVMLDIRATGLSGNAFAARLLDEKGVAVMPGESFGQAAAGHVRVALTLPDRAFEQAIAHLLEFAATLARAA